MPTKYRTVGQVVGITNRGRGNCRGQDKAVIGINGRMLFEPKVGDIVFDSPV
jgi:hypothetical protein